jgi:Lrp/AsnC family transcriptional regulator, leucine-responsive regulatory protein
MPPSLDAVDRRLLRHLQQNARISTAELAEKVGLSVSPAWRRVRALEEAGVITGYQALVDPGAVGLSVSVFIHVSLEKQIETALETFEAAVRRRPEVMECYLMTGDADYLLRVVVPDLAAYERFLMDHLTRIRGIASIKSSFALRPVKHGSELPLPDDDATPARKGRRARRTV